MFYANPFEPHSLRIAEDLCRKKRPYEAVPHLTKALQTDPSNLDAAIQLAFLAPDFDESIDVLETAERMGDFPYFRSFSFSNVLFDLRAKEANQLLWAEMLRRRW